MTTATTCEKKHLGKISFDVYRTEDGNDFVFELGLVYSEAVAQMNALLSPCERQMKECIFQEAAEAVVAFFAYVSNPEKYKEGK